MISREQLLLTALKERDESNFWKILSEADKFDLNAIDAEKKSYVHYAAQWGKTNVIEEIVIKLRCPINIKDIDGKLAKDYDWSGRLNKANEKRKGIEDNEYKQNIYEVKVEDTRSKELKDVAYQPGIVFTNNFSLHYSTRHGQDHKKWCEILDKKIETSTITIHDLLAITEAHVVSVVDDAKFSDQPEPFIPSLSSTNFLIGNIGCVITDIKHNPRGEHSRIFITKPINLDDIPVVHTVSGHSEEFFLKFLENEDVVKQMFECLLKENGGIEKSIGKKIYTIIFDLHSSQDVCTNCEKAIFSYQEQFSQNMKKIIKEMGFKVPEKKEDRFKVIFRISSMRPPSATFYRNSNENYLRPEEMELARIYTHEQSMDLKKSSKKLILHSGEKMQQRLTRWYSNSSYNENIGLFSLQKPTIFKNKDGTISVDLPKKIPMPNFP